MKTDLRSHHAQLVKDLEAGLAGNDQRIRIKKKTISNLFRYDGRSQQTSREVDLSNFDRPLYFDAATRTLEVQGLTTYERIVDFTLPLGFLPTVTPELKHITIGGATVGIGIEANSYRYGFVHDGLIEAEVLLPSGKVVVCRADNDYADLFYGLPNSYGTLGYILRATIQLRPAEPFVELTTEKFTDYQLFLAAMQAATKVESNDYIESLVYAPDELYLIVSHETSVGRDAKSIYGSTIFYREISKSGTLLLPTKGYIFRYDPEWFWAIPETGLYAKFRKYAPRRFRNSGFYARYLALQGSLSGILPFLKTVEDDSLEQLIQDWEVPWKQADTLLKFALDTFDLPGVPLMATPIKTPAHAACYPMIKDELYLNLGSYNYVRKQPGQPAYFQHESHGRVLLCPRRHQNAVFNDIP